MWERFTETTKSLVLRATEVSTERGSEFVGAEHLLLALCREPESLAVRTLERLGVDIDTLFADLERRMPVGEIRASPQELSFSAEAKKVLENSVEAARQLSDAYIGTEHVLLGLIEENAGMTAEMLREAGVNRKTVETDIQQWTKNNTPTD